jgi:hypothetical protein
MLSLVRATLSARWISAASVFVVAWIIGGRAAEGLAPAQWLGAAAALAGVIGWAVTEQVWPREAVRHGSGS